MNFCQRLALALEVTLAVARSALSFHLRLGLLEVGLLGARTSENRSPFCTFWPSRMCTSRTVLVIWARRSTVCSAVPRHSRAPPRHHEPRIRGDDGRRTAGLACGLASCRWEVPHTRPGDDDEQAQSGEPGPAAACGMGQGRAHGVSNDKRCPSSKGVPTCNKRAILHYYSHLDGGSRASYPRGEKGGVHEQHPSRRNCPRPVSFSRRRALAQVGFPPHRRR